MYRVDDGWPDMLSLLCKDMVDDVWASMKFGELDARMVIRT